MHLHNLFQIPFLNRWLLELISLNYLLLLGVITISPPPLWNSLTNNLVVLGSTLDCPLQMIVWKYYGVNLIFVVELVGSVMFGDLGDNADMVHLGEKII